MSDEEIKLDLKSLFEKDENGNYKEETLDVLISNPILLILPNAKDYLASLSEEEIDKLLSDATSFLFMYKNKLVDEKFFDIERIRSIILEEPSLSPNYFNIEGVFDVNFCCKILDKKWDLDIYEEFVKIVPDLKDHKELKKLYLKHGSFDNENEDDSN